MTTIGDGNRHLRGLHFSCLPLCIEKYTGPLNGQQAALGLKSITWNALTFLAGVPV
jgi:hypothetical protein